MVDKKLVQRIREAPKYSDKFMVLRRVVPELLDTAAIGDNDNSLKSEKEEEEIRLIRYIAGKLAGIDARTIDDINNHHDEMLRALNSQNRMYEDARASKDPAMINEARLGLILDVINSHHSKATLADFLTGMSHETFSEVHHPILTSMISDINPNLGYLLRQDNDLGIKDIVDTMRYVETSAREPKIRYSKDSELSENLFMYCMQEAKSNDGKLDSYEALLLIKYAKELFDFTDEEIRSLVVKMKKENELLAEYTRNPRNLPRLKLTTDVEKKVRRNILKFIDITNHAFEDNNLSTQEEEICRTTAKYLGIRTKESYSNLINYCKKKVIIANGNTLVSDNLARILNKTAITPSTIPIGKVIDYMKNNPPPIAVIVDLDKGEEAAELILDLKNNQDFHGRIYGLSSKFRPREKENYIRTWGVDMCFSPYNATDMKNYITNDFGIKPRKSSQR
ncbi:hypothetical protein COV19_01725 [Candidatus Woesearchaeota archaeon CG10_big_fil_rev_8_21_14_0_10_44_13]|nr:MAG: hypothetical protein COV19_01725 [Candidatus Woesearchaeota archaeon CG10_big_fil_rev_8_21_14_0_10_44_13]